MKTIYRVIIEDHSQLPPQSKVAAILHHWKDAAERVRVLNKEFEESNPDMHAYYSQGIL